MPVKTKRIKLQPLSSRLEFERTIDSIAKAETEQRALLAEQSRAIQTIQATFAPSLTEISRRLKGEVAQAVKYAADHRTELLPGQLKSAETPLARWGFRTGKRQLDTLSGWTWEKVLNALAKFNVNSCIRTKYEVDKETILKLAKQGAIEIGDDPTEIHSVPLSSIGVKIVQGEDFYIDPKVDGAEVLKPEPVQ